MSDIQNNALKPFWRSDGMDKIADLNEMKKAVVVAFYTPIMGENYYAISTRSYFPFTNAQHHRKYDNYYDCCMFAESIILDWVKSLLLNEQDAKSVEIINKVIKTITE